LGKRRARNEFFAFSAKLHARNRADALRELNEWACHDLIELEPQAST
jgi:hypothetical protein